MRNLRNTERPSTECIRRRNTSGERLEAGTVDVIGVFAGDVRSSSPEKDPSIPHSLPVMAQIS